MLEFDELRLRVRRIGPGRYLAVANGPVHGTSVLTVNDEPRRLRAAFDRLMDRELGLLPRAGEEELAGLRKIGREVFGLFFGGDLGANLAGAQRQAEAARGAAPSRGLRLRFDLPPELQDLPVETLTAPADRPEQAIGLNSSQSLVRSLPGSSPHSRLPGPRDQPEIIHLLVAVATPADRPEIDPEPELARVEAIPEIAVRTTVLRHATQRGIDQWLDDHLNEPTAVLLIAHGSYDEAADEGVVYLESESGASSPVSGNLLGGILVRAQRLRLVVLNLCSSAAATPREPFAGVAQALIGHGVPAVVGMRTKVDDQAAGVFGPIVLDGICANLPVDEAVTAARQHMLTASGHASVGWAAPALFLHEECGYAWLFKAKEVQAAGVAAADPLHDGARALDRLGAPGRVELSDLVAAARYLRARRDWKGVLARVRTKRASAEEDALAAEARLELAWPQIDLLCSHLAAGRAQPAAAVLAQLPETADEVTRRLGELLRQEIAEAGRYATGLAAEAQSRWQDAIEAYGSCPDYGDAAARLRHAQWQSAGAALAAEEWAAAASRYRALPASDPQAAIPESGDPKARDPKTRDRKARDPKAGPPKAADMASYADARLAEAEGRWDEAQALYAALPPALSDAVDRKRYVTGRMHAADGRWELVIEGFGGLPDSYAAGTVGQFRAVARARVAGQRGDWQEALSYLGTVPGTSLGGQVGLVRQLAYGRLAENEANWLGAAGAYGKAADTDPAMASERDYSLGRDRESHGDWQGALSLYAVLPAVFRDAGIRAGYATARLAEEALTTEAPDAEAGERPPPDWGALLSAYRGLPGDFQDVQTRAGYALAQLSIANGDWTSAIAAADQITGFADSAELADYARGRQAAEQHRWPEAAEFFERTPFADAGVWVAYAHARDYEATGSWHAAIEAYEAAGPLVDAADRRAWLGDLLDALPWAEGVAQTLLVPDPLAERDPAFPYAALRAARVTPASSTEAVNDAIYTLMEQGNMAGQVRLAWEDLRIPARRLLIDALLHRLRRPEELTALLVAGDAPGPAGQQAGEQGQPGELPMRVPPTPGTLLTARLGDDAPLITLLAGDREAAMSGWRQRLAAAPADLVTVHCLAVATYWQAHTLEETGAWEQAVPAWRESLAYWAVLLTNGEYWAGWRQSRAACYGHAVTPADTARLRVELGQYLTQQLSFYSGRHANAGRPEQGRSYRELLYLLEANLDGAGALQEAGGLPLPVEPAATLACSPGYLPIVGLARSIADFAWRTEQAHADDPDADGAALRRVRWAFSELSSAYSHAEHHRFEQALSALPQADLPRMVELPPDCPDAAAHTAPGATDACPECQRYLRDNPAYARLAHRGARLLQDTVSLAVRAHLCIARDLLPVRPDAAVAALSDAIQVSDKAAMGVRTKEAVVRIVLGRVEALTRPNGPRLDRLNDAIALVRSVQPVLGKAGSGKLTAKLPDLLVDRGIWYRLDCVDEDIDPDIERSLADLREAMELNPESASARAHLARARIFGSDGRIEDRPDDVMEGLRLLDEGLRRTPASGILGEAWRLALSRLEPTLLVDLSITDLATVMSDYSDDDAGLFDPPRRAQYLSAQARRRGDAGDSSGALRLLVRASRTDPVAGPIRRVMLAALEAHFAKSKLQAARGRPDGGAEPQEQADSPEPRDTVPPPEVPT